jgi:hypothetical protein
MNDPRKHHFIPAFYLKRWALNDGLLIEWSKPHKAILPQRRHPNATGYQKDLYSFPGMLPEAREWFEQQFLKHVDDLASEVLSEIEAGNMAHLNAEQKSGWVRFLMTLRFRHPDLVAEMREAIGRIWAAHDGFTRESYAKIRSPTDPETFDDFIASLSPDGNIRVQMDLLVSGMDNEQIGRHIMGMSWALIDLANSAYRLLTSDWPVELNLGAKVPTVSLAIGPSLLFVASDSYDFLQMLTRMDPSILAQEMNRFAVSYARRYVFSSDESQATFIRNRMSRDKAKPPFFPALSANRS